MDINYYNLYSTVSNNQHKKASDQEMLLKLVEKFDEIRSISLAKEYLEDTWGITEQVTKYPIGENFIVNTKETEKGFSVNFEYQDENLTYYYQK